MKCRIKTRKISQAKSLARALLLMDQMESLVMKKGWPVPFTDYYLVNHEQLLGVVDQLRASLQDELDARLIDAYGEDAAEPDVVATDFSQKTFKRIEANTHIYSETMKQAGLVGARSGR